VTMIAFKKYRQD